jgi:hypothetical protein
LRLEPTESTLLEVLTSVEDGAIDTESASRRVTQILRERGASFTLHTTPPWFGLQPAAARLENLGVLEVDPGLAHPVSPGQPSSSADHYILVTSEARIRQALQRLDHLGQIDVAATKTLDKRSRTTPWYVVTIELVCGQETVMVTGESTTSAHATAIALEKALARQDQG